jgi:hypothetical protein
LLIWYNCHQADLHLDLISFSIDILDQECKLRLPSRPFALTCLWLCLTVIPDSYIMTVRFRVHTKNQLSKNRSRLLYGRIYTSNAPWGIIRIGFVSLSSPTHIYKMTVRFHVHTKNQLHHKQLRK